MFDCWWLLVLAVLREAVSDPATPQQLRLAALLSPLSPQAPPATSPILAARSRGVIVSGRLGNSVM